MRVLQVNSLFSGGGADSQTLELALALRDRGVDVSMALAAGCRWLERVRSHGLPVHLFPKKGTLKRGMIAALARLLRTGRHDLVHAHQGRDYWPVVVAARLAGTGAQAVVTRHLMTRPRAVSRLLLLRFANVIAVSRAVEQVLRRELRGPRQRLHQVYGGIDVERFSPERAPAAWQWRAEQGWTPQQVVFGVVGGYYLPRGKGQLEFLEAAAGLRNDFPLARFAAVGGGTMETKLQQRRQELGLEAVCALLPFLDDNLSVISGLDVLVHPAVGTEAFGLVILEAMACGKPVIASNLDGIPELVSHGEHGLLVPPADVSALRQAMAALMREPEKRAQYGQAGRKHVAATFTRAELGRRVLDIYRQLVGRGL